MPRADATIDTRHEGRVEYVASRVLETPLGPVLVDTGPGSTVRTLRQGLAALGIGIGDLHAVLLSHIHFDHAGAVGLLAREHPGLRVYVHQRGAPHLIDPTRLVASATRIYGERMETLWGPFLPVPAAQIQALVGGETLDFAGRRFDVLDTPGHAIHHLVYFEAADATAYVGDVGGIRVPSLPHPLPVTPPPDFDLEGWLASIERVRALRPRRLFCTHFGFSERPDEHLDLLARGLVEWAETARASLQTDQPDSGRADRFHEQITGWLATRGTAEQVATFAAFADFRSSWHGIARYWRKRRGDGPAAPAS
jgi:glyoxylase-like metal-dependent hydrolase (beta-lactamase superfamily II)